MARIYQTGPEDYQWAIDAPDGRTFGTVLPPEDAEVLAIYEALVAANVVHEPFVAPSAPVPDISDRQFAAGLWGSGIISYADFLGFIGPGTIPAPILAIVNQLPDDDTGAPTRRKMAVGFLTGSKTYEFAHPLVEFFREAMAAKDAKWTVDYLRAEWRAWANL